MRIFRFFRELFNPSLKCARLSHHIVPEKIRIRKRSSEWREVVADYEAFENRCRRCGMNFGVAMGEKLDGYSGCSMPQDMWDKMDAKGYIVMS